jgi:hypothetical protein
LQANVYQSGSYGAIKRKNISIRAANLHISSKPFEHPIPGSAELPGNSKKMDA